MDDNGTGYMFSVEMDMSNFDRRKVVLPEGFSFMNGSVYDTRSRKSRIFGGKVKSALLPYSGMSLGILASVLSQLVDAGGENIWMSSIRVRISAGDLGIDKIKRLISFGYRNYQYIVDYCKVSRWVCLAFGLQLGESEYSGMMSAMSTQGLRRVLEINDGGYLHNLIDVGSYFIDGTIGVGLFCGTKDPAELRNCVDAAYRMFSYAVGHDEEDIRPMSSTRMFIDGLGLPERVPDPVEPLLFQGPPDRGGQHYVRGQIYFKARYCAAVKDALGSLGSSRVAVVSSRLFLYEIGLSREYDIAIYNDDAFNNFLYGIASGKRVAYNGDLSWAQAYNRDDTTRQLAVALYLYKISGYVVGSRNEYKDTLLREYKLAAEGNIVRTEAYARRIAALVDKAEYHYGNLDDALSAGEKNIFFGFDADKKGARLLDYIAKNSDFELGMSGRRDVDYLGLAGRIRDDVTLLFLSDSAYLDQMRKIAFFGGMKNGRGSVFLYSTREKASKICARYDRDASSFQVRVPPDDLDIDDWRKLRIVEVSRGDFYRLQTEFVRKVRKVSKCYFAYLVMYDGYCLGGVGFDFSTSFRYDVFQLSDFSTNGNVPRLSKMILLCALSVEMRALLSRRLAYKVSTVFTYAYTSAPVSMKYRGLYKIDREMCKTGALAYVGEMGKCGTLRECVERYKRFVRENGKGRQVDI